MRFKCMFAALQIAAQLFISFVITDNSLYHGCTVTGNYCQCHCCTKTAVLCSWVCITCCCACTIAIHVSTDSCLIIESLYNECADLTMLSPIWLHSSSSMKEVCNVLGKNGSKSPNSCHYSLEAQYPSLKKRTFHCHAVQHLKVCRLKI